MAVLNCGSDWAKLIRPHGRQLAVKLPTSR